MGYRLSIVLLCLLWICSGALGAKLEQNIEQPDTLYLGTRFYLTLSSDQGLASVQVPDSLTKFSVQKTEVINQKSKPPALRLTIIPLDTGSHIFPSLVVKPANPGQAKLRSQSFMLTIHAFRNPKDTLLVDIAPVQRLPGELPYWAYWAVGFVLILAVLGLGYYLWRRWKRQQNEPQRILPAMQDNRPNWKKAMEALYALQQEKLPEQGRFNDYHFRLSEIMKLFLEADYSFSANEMTTREILQYCRHNHVLPADELKEVGTWLEGCDRVKFAKVVPSLEDCTARMDWILRWLMQKRGTEDLPEAVEQPHV